MDHIDEIQIGGIVGSVLVELESAIDKFPKFNSAHEGYAIIKEELDELWDEIKNKDSNPNEQRKEAVQVAAMAIRFMLDLCGGIQ